MGKPIAELGGRRWAELEVLEHDSGQLLFPAEMRRRMRDGSVKVEKVRFRVPSPNDTYKARAKARGIIRRAELDEDKDRDLFRQVEQLYLLSLSIRTFEPPHSQFATYDELAEYDEGSLRDIQEQVNQRKDELDPREPVVTDDQFWKATVAVVREMDARPLADIDGRDQNAFVVRMALEALRSPTGLSWLQSQGISIPAISPSPSSSESSQAAPE